MFADRHYITLGRRSGIETDVRCDRRKLLGKFPVQGRLAASQNLHLNERDMALSPAGDDGWRYRGGPKLEAVTGLPFVSAGNHGLRDLDP
jgi:hypothetical protein